MSDFTIFGVLQLPMLNLLSVILNQQSTIQNRKVPLRFVLLVPFVLQIFTAVGLTAWLSLRNGQQAVNEVTNQLRSEITARIRQHLHTYLAKPHLINQINADAIGLGKLDLEDLPDMGLYFTQEYQWFDSASLICVGIEKQGNYIEVVRQDDRSMKMGILTVGALTG